MFLKFHLSDDKTKADQNSPHTIGSASNEIWETGDWTVILQAQNGPPVHRMRLTNPTYHFAAEFAEVGG
jgi:hypothetical protein